MRSLSVAILLCGAMLTGGAGSVHAQEERSPASAPAKAEIGSFGFDEAGMDRTVKPGDDFFAYANGTWISNTPIHVPLA